MRYVVPSLFVAVAVFFSGCEDRVVLTRPQAIANAFNLQQRDGLDWGAAQDVQPPGTPDAKGRRWWQITYRPAQDGCPRIMLVDADSGWAQRAAPDYRVRMPPANRTTNTKIIVLEAGADVLVVSPASIRDSNAVTALNQEAQRLDDLASRTGLPAGFGVRTYRDGKSALIYGWNGEHGIQRTPQVTDWLSQHTTYRNLSWENYGTPTP